MYKFKSETVFVIGLVSAEAIDSSQSDVST